jgi:hypothetical protein
MDPLMTIISRLDERVCTNCKMACTPTQLYCPRCGYILPDALKGPDAKSRTITSPAAQAEDEGSTSPLENGVETNRVRVLPGTAFFHQQARLYLHHDSGKIIPVDVRRGTQIVGRRGQDFLDSEIIDLTDLGAKEFGVSRRHLQLVLRDELVYAIDLNSTNGTFLNRERMIPETPYLVRNRTVLQLGVLVLRVQFA